MTTYIINKAILPESIRRHHYMEDFDKIDYLGQILLQMGFYLPPQARSPSDLGKFIFPFTFNLRGKISDTILTLQILQLDMYERSTHEERLNALLKPFAIRLEFKHVRCPLPKQLNVMS